MTRIKKPPPPSPKNGRIGSHETGISSISPCCLLSAPAPIRGARNVDGRSRRARQLVIAARPMATVQRKRRGHGTKNVIRRLIRSSPRDARTGRARTFALNRKPAVVLAQLRAARRRCGCSRAGPVPAGRPFRLNHRCRNAATVYDARWQLS